MDNKEIKTTSKEGTKHINRREWVKNIIIAFLLVMLVLTFFSNTIMNYSLPEVSVTRVSRSKVSKAYSLDLTVEANKTYSVTADESRDIKRVAVRKGQEVKEGQTLFFLEEMKDSTEVKTLEENIETEKALYEKALITASPDYFALNQAVQMARDKVNQAIDAKNNAPAEPSSDPDAERRAQAEQKDLNSDLAKLEAGNYDTLSSDISGRISSELTTLTNAENELKTAESDCEKYKTVIQNAGAENGVKTLERALETKKLQLQQKKNELAAATDEILKGELKDTVASLELDVKYAEEDLAEVKKAVEELAKAESTRKEKSDAYEKAKKVFDRKIAEVSSYINERLSSLGGDVPSYEGPASYSGADSLSGKTDYDAAIREAQYELDAAINALEQKRKEDAVLDEQTQVDLNAQKKKIEKLEADLDKLLSKQASGELVSPVDGVVEQICFAAGQSFAPGEELMVLNISADGFTSTATVTAEQAKAVKKGTKAKITDSNADDVTVTVKNVAKDKSDSSKFALTFTVEGDVVAGQTLKAELGESASQFDKVVPRNAVKQDTSGRYVYVVKSKSTPLGNRYLAEKVSVTIVAEDDTQCAVTGDFGDSADYIITASSKPFTAGDQVRFTQE